MCFDYCDIEWFALELTEIILLFLILYPRDAFQTLVDYDGYSISSKGFLPTVVDIMFSLVKFTHSVHVSSLIPETSMFTLPSPAWPLPICFNSWTWCSSFLCSIAPYRIRFNFHHQSHPQLDVIFALAPSLHSFCATSSIVGYKDLKKGQAHNEKTST